MGKKGKAWFSMVTIRPFSARVHNHTNCGLENKMNASPFLFPAKLKALVYLAAKSEKSHVLRVFFVLALFNGSPIAAALFGFHPLVSGKHCMRIARFETLADQMSVLRGHSSTSAI